MENVAAKSSALFFVIPNVTSLSSGSCLDEPSEGIADLITRLMADVDNLKMAEGNKSVVDSYL